MGDVLKGLTLSNARKLRVHGGRDRMLPGLELMQYAVSIDVKKASDWSLKHRSAVRLRVAVPLLLVT